MVAVVGCVGSGMVRVSWVVVTIACKGFFKGLSTELTGETTKNVSSVSVKAIFRQSVSLGAYT
jgi:hypothetical protein